MALKYIEPKRPRSETMSDGDSLVIWGHSRLSVREDGTAGLLGHRIVIVDSSGRVWPAAAQRFFYPRNGFARTATVFDAYPRWEEELRLGLTYVEGGEPVWVSIRNPRVNRPEEWEGESLPASQRVGDYTILLSRLVNQNTGPRFDASNTNRYWEPVVHVVRSNNLAWGWEKPVWQMIEATGNHGPQIGLEPETLRYRFIFMPKPANLDATIPLVTLSPCWLEEGRQSETWNLTTSIQGQTVNVLLLSFEPKNTFADGILQPDPTTEPTLLPVGWTTMGVGAVRWNTHSTRQPTIYLHTRDEDLGRRLGVRLRDDRGRLHSATPDPAGPRDGIFPYLLDLPAGVDNVTPEIVLLQPLQAEFTVRPPAMAQPFLADDGE